MSPAAAAAAADELHQAVQDALDLLQEAIASKTNDTNRRTSTTTTLPLFSSSSSSLSSSSLSTNHPPNHHTTKNDTNVLPTTRNDRTLQEVTPPPRDRRHYTIQDHDTLDDDDNRHHGGGGRRRQDGRVSGERYELRRLARRLDRAITSLSEQEDAMDIDNQGHGSGGAFLLSEQMVHDLFTVITTLSGLFEPNNNDNNTNKNDTEDPNNGGGPQQFVALYHNAVQTACQLLLEQMQMNNDDSILHQYYCYSPDNDDDNDNNDDDPRDHPAVAVVDDLLDRVVSLCLRTNHFSFVPPHDHHHSNHNNHRSSSSNNNYYKDKDDSGWILLGPVIFLLNKLLTQQQEHDCILPNLGIVENIKLLQLLWNKSLQDLSVPWRSQLLLDQHSQNQGDVERQETTHVVVGAMQEAKVQVRVLAGFLLRQLSFSISQSLVTDHRHLPHQLQTIPTIRPMPTFDTWATQFVAQQVPAHEHEHEHEDAILTKIDVEDFTDLASEIVVELMEYALDALDGVSASIRSLVTTYHPTLSATSMSSSSSEFHEDDSPLPILEAGDSMMEDMGSMLCEAIRHTLYAVTMVELLQGVSGIQIISCPSKTIRSLYSSFSTFVASTCHEAMEHVSSTHSQGQHTTTTTMNQFQNTRSAADDLLLRLSRLVLLHHENHHGTTSDPYAIQSEDEPTHHATSIAIMRALTSHGITDRNDSTFFLVNGSNSDEAHYSQGNNPTKRHPHHEEEQTPSLLKRARIHVLQAAATSSLILPGGFASLGQDEHCNDQDTEFPPGYERLEQVAFLTQSLIPPKTATPNTKDDRTSSCEPSRSSNVLDPWHALLSRKIGSEIDALLNDTNHADGPTSTILSEYANMVQPCFDTMTTSQNQ
eukprot:scaffold9914_cov57-Attheya_sp.AAC.2